MKFLLRFNAIYYYDLIYIKSRCSQIIDKQLDSLANNNFSLDWRTYIHVISKHMTFCFLLILIK